MIAVELSEATLERCEAHRSADHWVAAERYLTEALMTEPANASLYYWRGRLRHLRGAPLEADADYTMALARGVDDPVELLLRRAELRAEFMGPVYAEIDYASAIVRNRDDLRAYAARAHHRHGQGDHAGAVEDISRAIRIEPMRAESYYDRSAYLFALDRVEDALADLELALELDGQL